MASEYISFIHVHRLIFLEQGLKKVLFSHPGQLDFPARHDTFHSHLDDGQGPRQVVCQLNKFLKSKLKLA